MTDEVITETITITQTNKDGKLSLTMALRDDAPTEPGADISIAYGMATCIIDIFESGFVGQLFSEKFGVNLTKVEV